MKMKTSFSEFLNERNWIYTIDLTAPFKTYDIDEDATAFAKSVIEIIENKYDEIEAVVGVDAAEEIDTNTLDEFRAVGGDEGIEQADYALEQLYDWADLYDVWIKKEF